MLITHFKIAFRNLLRSKIFTSINIFGLACGISVSLLMFIHIRHELSYETFIQDHELIYRIGTSNWAKVPPILTTFMRQHVPGTEISGRFYSEGARVIEYNGTQIPTQHNYLVDWEILSVFRFPFVYGNAEKALANPRSIVITQDVASKIFGDIDPTGKVIMLDDMEEFTVTGVLKDIPTNSHLKIETLVSLEGSNIIRNESRSWKGVDTYIRFSSARDAAAMPGKLREFKYKFYEGKGSREEIDRFAENFELHPLSGIHLHSHREKEMGRNSDIQYVYIFSVLSIFIILIASINFVNLFTAQSVRRMKEIGIKKVVGASRGQLFRQFLLETFVMSLIATLLALILAQSALPFYNQLAGLALQTADLFNGENLWILTSITAVVAALSGFYPALVISKYKVSESLSRYAPKGSIGVLRKSLVTFQFVISCLVILVTVVVSKQMNYIRSRDLGLDKEGVVTIKLYGQLAKGLRDKEALRTTLLSNHNIRSVAISNKLIGERMGFEGYALAGVEQEEDLDIRGFMSDDGLIPTLGLTLLEGRNFLPTDTVAYILNESAAKALSDKEVIGKAMGRDPDEPDGPVVGIVKDFNYASLHTGIGPLVLEHRQMWPNNLLVRVNNTEELTETLEFMKKQISAFAPGSLIIFNFFDDQLDLLYETELRLFRVFNVFSALSIIIAVLGLVALSAHTLESRVKEIGIRKVLGAGVADILLLLSSDYVRLLLVASLLSVPLAWYFSNTWLSTFAYRIDLAWWIFTTPCILLVVFTLLVLAIQALKPAMADPVKSLRYE